MLYGAVIPNLSHTRLLSGFGSAVTVRRLWIGAEAKNADSIISRMVMLANMEHDLGTERTNGCAGGKAWLLSATRFTRR
jgi:hypothetical protein